MMFEDSPWLLPAWEKLAQSIKVNRLPHALLFTGQDSLALTRFASKLAEYLLCKSEEKPCHTCSACLLFKAETHPDYYVLAPEEKGKAIKIADIRLLREKLSQAPQQSGYRIVIIEYAHAMNRAASNAMLKTLEEPGRDTLLMLLSNQPGQLLATIRSRCQQVSLASPTQEQAQAALPASEMADLLPLSNYSLLQTQQWHQDGYAEIYQGLLQQLHGLTQGKYTVVDLAQYCQKLSDRQFVLDCLLFWVSGMVYYKTLASWKAGPTGQRYLETLAKKSNINALYNLYDKILERKRLTNQVTGLNFTLTIESILLNWSKLLS